MNNKAVAIIALFVAISAAVLLVWKVQASRMRTHFINAMRNGEVHIGQVDLQKKVWTEEELATTEVLKLDTGYGRERSIERSLHSGGQYTLSQHQYTYQATVMDADTGIKHVFGYLRAEPRRWSWAGIHPDSAEEHIRLRQEQVDQMRQRGVGAVQR